MTIVESTRPVTGGVDTHLDQHVAAALDATGALLGVESFPATAAGYRDLHGWLAGFGEVVAVGVEGTGAYGVGLARFLHGEAVTVIEVDRPNRQERRRNGKSDQLDAVEAARAALSGRANGIAKTADGNVEAIRVLLVAKRSARAARTKALTQIRHLGFCAPDALRDQLRDVPVAALAGRVAALRPRPDGDVVTHGTKVALQILGRRVLALDDELDRLNDPPRAARRGGRAAAARASTASGPTPPPRSSSPPATTPNDSGAKPPGPTSAASPRSKHRPDARPGTGSTAAATARPTTRSGGS